MYHLILIDDDEEMIKRVIAHVPFEQLNILLIDFANNGIEGLEKILNLRPDIILCDINMPKLSGFAMIEKIREYQDYQPQIIMLTGYQDFEHTKTAIKYKVLDYLVKPVMPDEIIDALKLAVTNCEKNRKLNDSRQEDLINLKCNFIERIFYDNFFTESDIKEFEMKLGLDLKSNLYVCIGIYIADYEALCKKLAPLQVKNIKENVVNKLREFTDRYYASYFNGNQIKIMLMPAEKDISEEIAVLQNIIDQCMECELFISVSRADTNILKIPTLIKQLEYCFKFSFCFRYGRLLFFDTINQYIKNSFNAGAFTEIEDSIKNTDIHSILDWHSCIGNLKSLVESFDYVEPEYIKNIVYINMNQILSNILSAPVLSENTKEQSNMWLDIAATQSMDELFYLCDRIADDFSEIINTAKGHRNSIISEQIKQYADSNYMNQITIVMISKKLYLSPNYLRQIFLQENGITFKQYLKILRMEKAKNMITEGKYKIYEIAQKVGYKDIKSFRIVFNEYYGVTPSEMNNHDNK